MDPDSSRNEHKPDEQKASSWTSMAIGGFLMLAGFLLLMGQFRDVPDQINWAGPGLFFVVGVGFFALGFPRKRRWRS